MTEFDHYLKKNSICHKVSTFYSCKQNNNVERVNHTIMNPVRAIFAQQKLYTSV